jgi:hypothetical protein
VPQDVLGKVRTLPDSPLIFRGKNLQVGVVAGRAGSASRWRSTVSLVRAESRWVEFVQVESRLSLPSARSHRKRSSRAEHARSRRRLVWCSWPCTQSPELRIIEVQMRSMAEALA